MNIMLKQAGAVNVPTNEYYVESLEELNEIENPPIGSTAIVSTEQGVTAMIFRTTGWAEM